MSLEYREVSFSETELMHAIGALRFKVWEEEQSINPSLFPGNTWIDSLDSTGRHWVALDGDKVVAAARLTVCMHDEIIIVHILFG